MSKKHGRMHIALFGRNIAAGREEQFGMLAKALRESGHTISCYEPFYEYICSKGWADIVNAGIFSSPNDIMEDVSLFLALGGDGTFLDSISFVSHRGIPVAGINFGRLGFLTTAQVGQSGEMEGVRRVLDGNYEILERSLLRVGLCAGEKRYKELVYCPYALNEVVLQRAYPHMIGLEVRVDGKKIPTYWADGILVSTATGSTAYSLSFGGPVAMPGSGVLIITPMAPHNLNVRPLILPETSSIEILPHSNGLPVALSLDNRNFRLEQGERVVISKAPFPLKCVQLEESCFFDALNEKLLWGEDKRNGAQGCNYFVK
ncbi:MAG: NAD(+)/NADH kinase [Candidatus Coprenecus sp.]|nr:NAD(+)/NADH kinase [Candidatus Coprenecus sp.]